MRITLISRHLVSLVAGLLFALPGCKKNDQKPPPAPPEVLIAEVKAETLPIYHEYVGSVEGFVNADIQARVSGYLLSQNYKEGSSLKKGDLLFQIDARPFEAIVAKSKADLAQFVASQKQAELTAKRNVELFTSKTVSAQERDNAVQLNRAAEAQVAAQEAQVKQAELDVEFTKIIAPIDGVVGLAKAQVGDLVGPSTGVLTSISTLDPIKVYFTVSEQRYTEYVARYQDAAERAKHEKELQFELLLANGSTYGQKGEFFATDREVDARTGSIRIAALFPNPGSVLRPGQFARVKVQSEVKEGALLVQQRAVTEIQGRYQVAVVGANNQTTIRPVTPGTKVGSRWVIEKGLKPGEMIVVEGVQKVTEGGQVVPKPWTPTATEKKPTEIESNGDMAGTAGTEAAPAAAADSAGANATTQPASPGAEPDKAPAAR